MAAKPKLTPEEWKKVRSTWELDPRDGYTWIIEELNIPMTRAALRKVAIRDGWVKKVSSDNVKESKNPKVLVKVLDNSPDKSPAKPASKGNSKKASKPKVSKVSQTVMVSKVSNDDGSDTINDEQEDESGSKPVGRPTGYRETYNKQAYRLCLLGATNDELAEFFEVGVSTIKVWKNLHPEFMAAIKKGKMDADSKVAARLYERAMGYSHPETHVSNYKGEITKTELIKHYPPDTVAAFIWLKNRQPKFWRDRIEASVEVKFDKDMLAKVEQAFIERMNKSRERQQAVLLERGITIDHQD